MWKRLLGAMLVLDVAAAALFAVYAERHDDTTAASPASNPIPCPTPVVTVDPLASPTPAVTLQISPAETPLSSSDGFSFDPGALEEGDQFGEDPAATSPEASSPGSKPAPSSSPSPSPAPRAPTSPDRLEAQVTSAAPLQSAAPLPSSGAQDPPAPSEFPSPTPRATATSPTPLSTPTLGSPTALETNPISPTPFECPSPQITTAFVSPSPPLAPTEPSPSPAPSASALVHADTPYENATLGYTFSYPNEWELRVNGSLTQLLNPGRQALVSFGRGPTGSLSKASDAYFSSLRKRYEDFKPAFTQVETISGAVSRVMVGRATNEEGKRLRFQAILIHGAKRNYAVAAFSALDIQPSVQAALDEVIGSFEEPPY